MARPLFCLRLTRGVILIRVPECHPEAPRRIIPSPLGGLIRHAHSGKKKEPNLAAELFKCPGGGIFSAEGLPSSIVCAGAFHFRVRDGNGWGNTALTTKT